MILQWLSFFYGRSVTLFNLDTHLLQVVDIYRNGAVSELHWDKYIMNLRITLQADFTYVAILDLKLV